MECAGCAARVLRRRVVRDVARAQRAVHRQLAAADVAADLDVATGPVVPLAGEVAGLVDLAAELRRRAFLKAAVVVDRVLSRGGAGLAHEDALHAEAPMRDRDPDPGRLEPGLTALGVGPGLVRRGLGEAREGQHRAGDQYDEPAHFLPQSELTSGEGYRCRYAFAAARFF